MMCCCVTDKRCTTQILHDVRSVTEESDTHPPAGFVVIGIESLNIEIVGMSLNVTPLAWLPFDDRTFEDEAQRCGQRHSRGNLP